MSVCDSVWNFACGFSLNLLYATKLYCFGRCVRRHQARREHEGGAEEAQANAKLHDPPSHSEFP